MRRSNPWLWIAGGALLFAWWHARCPICQARYAGLVSQLRFQAWRSQPGR